MTDLIKPKGISVRAPAKVDAPAPPVSLPVETQSTDRTFADRPSIKARAAIGDVAAPPTARGPVRRVLDQLRGALDRKNLTLGAAAALASLASCVAPSRGHATEAFAGPRNNPLNTRIAAATDRGPAQTSASSTIDVPGVNAQQPLSVRVDFGFGNDNFPKPVVGLLPSDDQTQSGRYADDDGFTSRLSTNIAVTSGANQFVLGGAATMITERVNDPGPGGYGARRQDLIEATFGVNRSAPLTEDTQIIFGGGVGVQRIGPQGLDQLQQWFHSELGSFMGGRTEFASPSNPGGLQNNYTTESVETYPLLTAGVGIVHDVVADGVFSLNANTEARIPIGDGLATIRAGAGFEWRPIDTLTIDGGVSLTGAYAMGDQLDFIDLDGVRPGARIGIEWQALDNASVFARVDVGGMDDEPTYTVGIAFGFGGSKKPRLGGY